MGDISRNFSFSEFEYSQTAVENGITNAIPSAEVRQAIRGLVETVLQPLRNGLGVPLIINSGYRCEDLNKLLGGAKTSQHRKGEAADIRSPFYSPWGIANMILKMGLPFDQLILYPSFVHVSHKRKGVQRRQVLYDSSYKGKKL